MEIRQQFVVAHDPATVWRSLGDIRLMASCIPGAEVTSISEDEREIKGRIGVRVGPIGAAFAGTARLTRDDPGMRGTLEGNGVDASNGSRTSLRLTYVLTPAEGGRATTVTADAHVTLAGLIAQFGKGGLIADIATQITKEFADRLQKALSTTGDATVGAPPATTSNELRPMRLFVAALLARLARIFRRSQGVESL